MNDLITWLRQQLDDDEQTAQAANPAPWSADPADDGDCTMLGPNMSGMHTEAYVDAPDAEHIARWDPARVLAEVEAKRLILDEIESWLDVEDDFDEVQTAFRAEATPMLRLFAQPYAGRPGWREEWRTAP